MKQGFRQSMAWLHTWSGLVVGWVLFFVFLTGTAGYFTHEITRWMEPERPLQVGVPEFDNRALAILAMKRLEKVAPKAAYWNITLPHWSQSSRQWEGFSVGWETMPAEGQERGVRGEERLDPLTGQLIADVVPRQTGGGKLLYRMHYALHYIDYPVAYRIVGVCTMLMLLAIVTGVITHKKIFKDFFTFRPGKGQRSWLDAHNIVSVMALPFFLMINYSGLLFFYTSYMPVPIAAVYGTDDKAEERYFDALYGSVTHKAVTRPAASVPEMINHAEKTWGPDSQLRSVRVQHNAGDVPVVEIGRVRGERVRWFAGHILRYHADTGELLKPVPDQTLTVKTHQLLLALHEGRFAESWLRWLYFFSGLLGAGMIGTGLVLWTVKRRRNHEANGINMGLRLVEALNIATIAGLPAGMAAYFWANRLLPVGMAERANWEANVLFLIWGEALIYAFFRCSDRDGCRKAWLELLWFAAAAFVLLPFINVLTTDKHLGVSLMANDWVLAGFDLTMIGLGLVFAYTALKIRCIWLEKPTHECRIEKNALPGKAI